jgi:heme/copper-type cytochrome/quinol oxidase subunit 2
LIAADFVVYLVVLFSSLTIAEDPSDTCSSARTERFFWFHVLYRLIATIWWGLVMLFVAFSSVKYRDSVNASPS